MILAFALLVWTTSRVSFGVSAMATNEQVVQALQDLQLRLAAAEAAAQQGRDDTTRLQMQFATALPAGPSSAAAAAAVRSAVQLDLHAVDR